ncbi:hypothetical protein BGZ81_008538 [Podila clonocystis]|nr:hypothetical protein BGZ81_008538 [Podila clonocystis]
MKTVLCAEDDGATNDLLNPIESKYSDFGREYPGGAKYPTLFLESLKLENTALLTVDDGMLEETVCAEEGGPTTMLPALDDECVDVSVKVVSCPEDDGTINVLFGPVEPEYPDFGRDGADGAKYPILFLESLMLEYMVLLSVDDGIFAKTVCTEDGGPAIILLVPEECDMAGPEEPMTYPAASGVWIG